MPKNQFNLRQIATKSIKSACCLFASARSNDHAELGRRRRDSSRAARRVECSFECCANASGPRWSCLVARDRSGEFGGGRILRRGQQTSCEKQTIACLRRRSNESQATLSTANASC